MRDSVAPDSFPVAPVTGPEALNSPVARSIVPVNTAVNIAKLGTGFYGIRLLKIPLADQAKLLGVNLLRLLGEL
jgi:hypothetical protein